MSLNCTYVKTNDLGYWTCEKNNCLMQTKEGRSTGQMFDSYPHKSNTYRTFKEAQPHTYIGAQNTYIGAQISSFKLGFLNEIILFVVFFFTNRPI